MIIINSPTGALRLAASASGLTHLSYAAAVPAGAETSPAAQRILQAAAHQLEEYFDGRRRTFDIPLDFTGTPFQVEVWNALLTIPFGATASYGEIARQVGRPTAVRAVGAANGANPISIIVPCHRVIGSDRRLTGYGGGLPRKRFLLAHEGGNLVGDRLQ